MIASDMVVNVQEVTSSMVIQWWRALSTTSIKREVKLECEFIIRRIKLNIEKRYPSAGSLVHVHTVWDSIL